MALIKEHTPGTVRYFEYHLEFPDGECWQDSIPFVHGLQFALKNTSFGKVPGLARDILVKGECTWEASHYQGVVKHTVKVVDEPCQKIWGSTKGNIRRAIEKDKKIDRETVKRIEEGAGN